MANKVYLDQTAPAGAVWSGYTLFTYAWPKKKHFPLCRYKKYASCMIDFNIKANKYAWGIKIFFEYSGMNDLSRDTDKVLHELSIYSILFQPIGYSEF